MTGPFHEVAVAGARLAFDPRVGNIRQLEFTQSGRVIAPLHTAPWVEDPSVQANQTVAPVERRLSGDFFCAPFGVNDVAAAPPHGWTANSAWQELPKSPGDSDGTARFRLTKKIFGSEVEKEIRLTPNAPLLYQTHRLKGGQGSLPIAHHPMTRMAAGGALCFSAKAYALTPPTALEPGRNRLAYPMKCEDLARFPDNDGGLFDLTHYPTETGHEDFVTLVEARDATLGWTAVLRRAEEDILFILKDPRMLPVTMLWFSNGGRDYVPWNGRHIGVLGIEDGRSAGSLGHAAALAPNALSEDGVPTALELRPNGERIIRHVIGAVPLPAGWRAITDIRIDSDQLILIERSGGRINLPFDHDFFSE